MRLAFVLLGTELIERFQWIMPLFGAFLVVTGIKMALQKEHGMDLESNPVMRIIRRLMPVTTVYHGQQFFIREGTPTRLTATPLFVVLALGMFGAFQLQMPAAIQTRLSNMANNQRGGTFLGTAIMGALTSLIVTTCVAPPLIGALTFISQTGDVARGSGALFAAIATAIAAAFTQACPTPGNTRSGPVIRS